MRGTSQPLDSRHSRKVRLVTSVTARVLAYPRAARSLARSCSLPFAPSVSGRHAVNVQFT